MCYKGEGVLTVGMDFKIERYPPRFFNATVLNVVIFLLLFMYVSLN